MDKVEAKTQLRAVRSYARGAVNLATKITKALNKYEIDRGKFTDEEYLVYLEIKAAIAMVTLPHNRDLINEVKRMESEIDGKSPEASEASTTTDPHTS